MSYRCLVFITLVLFPFSLAGFAEIPANVTVELGTPTPPSRCRHMISDAFITWRVNGFPIGQFPAIRSGSVNEDGNMVYTLTIPAEPQYNGTVVECLAVFFDGSPSEVSPAATIFFTLAISLPDTTHFEITPTNTPPVTFEVSTSSPPDTTDFVITPTNTPPVVTFEITPSPLTVAVERGTATFQCQHPLADVIGWGVNGIPLNVATLQNVSAVNVGTPNGATTTLSIGTLLVYNGITIECVATFFDGSLPQFTEPVALLIQDTPKQVENVTFLREYSEHVLTTLWDPLPTLDITDTDPDILYTVELYQITCGQNILMNRTEVAGSNVTVEGLDLMQIYKAVIAARNNVRDARNGPSVEMKEKFMSLNGSTLLNLARGSPINIQSNAPVPSYYETTLESLDGREDLVTNITVERNGEMIDMSVEESVPPNSLWRASILAYGCESDRIVTNYELSTHDVQNIVASSQLPGQISVTGELISGATATGVLVVVYSLTNSNDTNYIAKQTEGNRISLNVTGLTGAEYGVSTFALENGLPFPGVVASPKNINITSSSHQDWAPKQPLLTEYDLIRTSSGICITCTFLDSSTTDCVAVVHQRISQLSSSGLMNIESSHKFTRSGDTAYGCIEGVNLEQYQVGVVGGRRSIAMTHHESSSPGSSYCLGCIIGTVCAAILVAVILVGATLSVLLYCTKRFHSLKNEGARPSPGESGVDVEMQRCGAYEVVRLSRQRVTMKDNPAYVDVHLHNLRC